MENGGGIKVTKDWVKHLFRRIGFVKRKAATKAKVDAENFEELKKAYLLDNKNIVEMDEIPEDLIIKVSRTVEIKVIKQGRPLTFNSYFSHMSIFFA